MKIEVLEPGNYYHIYNRGNNGERIFFDDANYSYFLQLYEKYISPVAKTLAWCLMHNHFHFLVYLKEAKEINKTDFKYSTRSEVAVVDPSRQLGHLFNSYTQAINKRYSRTGSVFEKPFERKKITSEDYLRKLVFYIHNNPVHHSVAENIISYPWTSYHGFFSEKERIIHKKEVFELFGDFENFKKFHQKEHTIEPFQGLEP
ncbi:transposase [Salinimicrobium xinjiangense]|uniref:transposase n=1 Tax=Salinimicrobium xinjiangense TaxID=438596 RepID=UPI000424DBF8|nr:transposase [Salinimicrobium xinjiangense]